MQAPTVRTLSLLARSRPALSAPPHDPPASHGQRGHAASAAQAPRGHGRLATRSRRPGGSGGGGPCRCVCVRTWNCPTCEWAFATSMEGPAPDVRSLSCSPVLALAALQRQATPWGRRRRRRATPRCPCRFHGPRTLMRSSGWSAQSARRPSMYTPQVGPHPATQCRIHQTSAAVASALRRCPRQPM